MITPFKNNLKKLFLIVFLRWAIFIMILIATLYNGYIDSPNKKPFEYIVDPPLQWAGSNNFHWNN